MQSNRAKSGNDGCHLENGTQMKSQGFNSALSGVFFFFLIWPQSTSCQEISDIHSLQTHSYGTRTRLVYIPVSSIQSDCDCSVKWRMCDHCAATNTLCGRVAGL